MRVSDTVESVLMLQETTRSSDRLLLIKVWEAHGFFMSETQKAKFMDLPSAETVRRIRQKLQEQGKYPASEYVRKQRKFKGMQVQQMIPKVKIEKVEELIQKPMFDLPPTPEERDFKR